MLSLLLIGLASTGSRLAPPPVLQPTTYASPSGSYTLLVDPSARLGSGPGRYALRREGVLVWERELPYTFREAVLSDEGFAAGYAYTAGERDFDALGDFVVAILAPDGHELRKDSERRRKSPYLDSFSDPLALGLLAQARLDRLVVRLRDEDVDRADETWRTYRMSTGEPLERFHPKTGLASPDALAECRAARGVPGTPLVLACFVQRAPEWGERFALLDVAGAPVWELDLPDEDRSSSSYRSVREHGAILAAHEPRRFALWHVAAGERVDYELRETQIGWQVEETARSGFEIPREPVRDEAPRIELPPLGAERLGGESPASRGPVRDVAGFSVRESGIEFVRAEKTGRAFTIVQLDQAGEARVERRFELPEDERSSVRWFPLSRGAWLLVASGFGPGAESSAWRVRPTSESLERLESFHCPPVVALDELADGGLVVLAQESTEFTVSYVLLGLEAEGGERWRVGGTAAQPTGLLSPQGVAVLADGRIAVCETIRNRVTLFSARGELLDVIDLAAALGQDPRQPSGIAAGPDGSLLVVDAQNAKAPLWHLRADGTLLGSSPPRFEDGRASDRLPSRCRFGPDGRLWTRDETSFLRLAPDGLVDRVLGEGASPDSLDVPGEVLIDHLGRICVQDRADGSVHVFDATGRRLCVCRFGPEDFGGRTAVSRLAAGPEGELYVLTRGGWAAFDRLGERIGTVPMPIRGLRIDASSGRRWLTRRDDPGDDLVLQDQGGVVLREIRRWPDGTWLDGQHAVAPDGRLCVVGKDRLAIYSPSGELAGSFELEAEVDGVEVAFAGERIVASANGRAWLLRTRDGSVRRFDVPIETKAAWTVGLSPDGAELWCVAAADRELHRYALPD